MINSFVIFFFKYVSKRSLITILHKIKVENLQFFKENK